MALQELRKCGGFPELEQGYRVHPAILEQIIEAQMFPTLFPSLSDTSSLAVHSVPMAEATGRLSTVCDDIHQEVTAIARLMRAAMIILARAGRLGTVRAFIEPIRELLGSSAGPHPYSLARQLLYEQYNKTFNACNRARIVFDCARVMTGIDFTPGCRLEEPYAAADTVDSHLSFARATPVESLIHIGQATRYMESYIMALETCARETREALSLVYAQYTILANGGATAHRIPSPVETPPADEHTFMAFGDIENTIGEERLRSFLEARGLHPARESASFATFVWQIQNTKLPKRAYEVRCDVKNVVDPESIALMINKEKLHFAIKQLPKKYHKYIARTWHLQDFRWRPGKYIIRPVGPIAFAGHHIYRATTMEELDTARKQLEDAKFTNVIISEYLDDPYLFNVDGELRKFHIRARLLVRPGAPPAIFGIEDGDLSPSASCMNILTAAKPYEHAHYDDADIHDTHGRTTPRPFFFPLQAEQITSPTGVSLDMAKVRPQLLEILEIITTLLSDQPIRCYPESQACYEVLGIDLMIVRRDADDSPHVILVEINHKMGYLPSSLGAYFDAYLQWVWEKGIEPCLKAIPIRDLSLSKI